MADALPNLAPGTAIAPPVAGNGAPAAPPTVAPGPSAAESAPKFGGFRGGKPRTDGLIPGTREAAEANKKKDAARKREERKRKLEPPPLPSASSGVAVPAQAPPGAVALVPGLEGPAPIPWDPGALKPLFDQLLPTLEQVTVNRVTGLAVEAKLPGALIHEIENDARWPVPAKKALEVSAPRVAAKWLNKSGISSEHQDELIFGTALAAIVASHTMLVRKLRELLAKTQAPNKPHENKTPEAAKPDKVQT